MIQIISKNGLPISFEDGAGIDYDAEVLALLKSQLQTGVCKFSYKKANGDIRLAYGTQKSELIPKYTAQQVQALVEASTSLAQNYKRAMETPELIQQDSEGFAPVLALFDGAVQTFQPKEKKERTANDSFLNYFDIEAQDWRKFNVSNLVALY